MRRRLLSMTLKSLESLIEHKMSSAFCALSKDVMLNIFEVWQLLLRIPSFKLRLPDELMQWILQEILTASDVGE